MSSQLLDVLKTQFIFSLSNKGIDQNSIKFILALQLFDKFINNTPHLIPVLYEKIGKYIEKKKLTPTINKDKEIKASITLDKFYNKENSNSINNLNNIVESIINLISTLDYVKSLLFNGYQLLPHLKETIPLSKDIYFKLRTLDRDDEGKMEKISFEIFTYTKDINYLKKFLYDCEKNYNISIQNKLGDDKFLFDQHIIKIKNPNLSGSQIQHPPFITYNKHPFTTNRNFDNIFFENKSEVKHRLDFFLNNKDWYDKKGIPYTLGFLFHGVPGCGKTSTIKAIANVTKRHIININLSEVKTKKQLKHLFFANEIICNNNSMFTDIRSDATEKFTIPVKDRLYVIEDIDASNSVISRFKSKDEIKPQIEVDDLANMINQGIKSTNNIGGFQPNNSKTSLQVGGSYIPEQISADDEEIDLTSLLNILDGTLETPNRIIIVTTNFPEKLDNALIRPGRIDMFIEFKKANKDIIKEFYENFYEKKLEEDKYEDIPDYMWTPAEVNQLLFQSFNNSEIFLENIIEKTPSELFKYSHVQ